MEVSVPLRGSARSVFQDMMKHLCSSISYGGADSLAALRTRFEADPLRYVIKLSVSARRESGPSGNQSGTFIPPPASKAQSRAASSRQRRCHVLEHRPLLRIGPHAIDRASVRRGSPSAP